jgi:hypothetical protein
VRANQPWAYLGTAQPGIRSDVCYIEGELVLRKFTLDIRICVLPPSPRAVCLFFKLDQYQEILMSISTTKSNGKIVPTAHYFLRDLCAMKCQPVL